MTKVGQYDAQTDIIEYIYGITFEIWEERGVELIRQYYAPDVVVYALAGVTDSADAVVDGTHATLKAFPDRLLLAENIIWSDDAEGAYSSHRIISPMTNLGMSLWGEPTGRAVRVRTIADCFVQEGVITREWLMRDTLPLVIQLGFDPIGAAETTASELSQTTRDWWRTEHARTSAHSTHPQAAWATDALDAFWQTGAMDGFYAPFVVAYPEPTGQISGLTRLQEHADELRGAFQVDAVKVDHVAMQSWAHTGTELAVRWTLSGTHKGSYCGLPATGKDVFVLGSSHWRIADGKIVTDWTVFDGIGVLAQLVG